MKTFNFLIILSVFVLSSLAAAEDTLSVQVKETKLRSAPRQWANTVAPLKYGDTVVPLKIENEWVEGLANSKSKGFVHISAMTSKKVVLSSSKIPNSSVDPSDVILAGKGFSKATEEEYSKQNTSSNFQAVNMVEEIKIPESELMTFMKDGRVGQGAK